MITFRGQVWRIVFADQVDAPTAPARAPEGRFHHDNQWAVYTSLSLEGAGVAIAAYVSRDDRERVAVPLDIDAQVVDLRTLPDPSEASIVWQTHRTRGLPAPTWDLSDAARQHGASGVLYPSRSRPELTHLALFHPSAIRTTHQAIPWRPAD